MEQRSSSETNIILVNHEIIHPKVHFHAYRSQPLVFIKGKVVPVLNLIKHYAMKAYGGVDV
jgi:hypothetical protein